MLFFSRNSFTFAYGGVNGAAAVQELEVLFGNLLADIMSEIAVGNKQYVFRVHIFNDFNRRGGGHANIAYGFEVCGGVDISNNFVIRVFLFDGADKLFIHLLCHGAACNGLSQNYLFSGESILTVSAINLTPTIITVFCGAVVALTESA